EISPLPLHDALPISEFVPEAKVAEQRPDGREMALDAHACRQDLDAVADPRRTVDGDHGALGTASSRQACLEGHGVVAADQLADRSEEHTSELQSRGH